MEQFTVPIDLIARDGRHQSGSLIIEKWTKKERTRRALKAGATSWGLALLSVFLPIAHFILVPAFFLGGPVAAWWMWKQTSLIRSGEGTCPFCQSKIQVGSGPEHWPIEELCTQCQNLVQVKKSETS